MQRPLIKITFLVFMQKLYTNEDFHCIILEISPVEDKIIFFKCKYRAQLQIYV